MHDAFDVRPAGPGTFELQSQRTREQLEDLLKLLCEGRAWQEKKMMMMGGEDTAEPHDLPRESLIDRTTLCLPNYTTGSVIYGGEKGFKDALRRYFPAAESNASERLVELKAKLREASTQDFWGILLEEMCEIMGSQCGFVAKRMLVDDQDGAVKMPELGEPGSSLMGVAFYINNGTGIKETYRDYRYQAFGTPCAHMKHDKVFIIPERMDEFLPDNPNAMPWKRSEAFISLPLFHEGKCFAHFGVLWNSDGASKRNLSWPFIEMFMHSLEDMILQRILEGGASATEVVVAAAPGSTTAKIIPLSAIAAPQSLQPYARSLSHELRTPMQGVVGMLDIMYATVLDAIADKQNDAARAVFADLKTHIEIVQDSSKRAVEAADNVVYAYDLNLQMPDTPLTPVEPDEQPVCIPITASSRAGCPSGKRTREHDADTDCPDPGPPPKRMFTMTRGSEITDSYFLVDPRAFPAACPSITVTEHHHLPARVTSEFDLPTEEAGSDEKPGGPVTAPALISTTHRRVITRDFMRGLVNEALRNGHPTSEVHTQTDLGETIEVRNLGSRGQVQERTIYLKIERDVPEVIITEEQHLQFSLQKIIDNAIKFTESGSITITVQLGKQLPVVEIWVADTGCGIAEESQRSLFQPHFQEDASISRSKDGLGLSLFNAKAHVRKNLGGDVTLERSATDGPSRGSEFLIRLPISSVEAGSTRTPLVGTPPSPGQRTCWPGPWADQEAAQGKAALKRTPSETTANFAITPTRQGSPLPSPRRRATFNRKLATEYPLRILIAEDNAINRDVAMGSLNKLGYSKDNITVAVDGVEAVRHFTASLSKSPEQGFDMILMDIWMPHMDGYEATKKIMDLAKEKGATTKIIAVTADITGSCINRAKGAGMQGFLPKPYKVLDIEHLIVDHFGRGIDETRDG